MACNQPAGPPLSVSDTVILEPLPGSGIAAGYLVVENHSDEPITIVNITSPEFKHIEMHESSIQDDIARMTLLEGLVVEGQSVVVFEPGGKHLMMIDAAKEISPGVPVTIEIHDSTNGVVSVTTAVRSRDGFPD